MLYSFMKDEKGLETVEYAVIMALMVGTLVAVMTALTVAFGDRFASVAGLIRA